MANEYRNHNCGELNINNVGQEVRLAGWIQRIRNLGGMTFIDLRDQYGITQITISDETPELETVMYNQPYVEVPDTAVQSSTVITALGFVILTLGAGTIYATKKKHSK